MADTILNLTSQPTITTSSIALERKNWTFTNSRLQSNSIGDSETTSAYIKFNAMAGTVKVNAGVSSEATHDALSIHVSQDENPPSKNSGNVANISGTTSGTYTYNITTPGIYFLHFSYAKDSSVSSGSDCCWVTQATLPIATDNISFLFTPTSTTPRVLEYKPNSWYISNDDGLRSNSISHNGQTSGYIKFNAKVGTIKSGILVKSESNCDYLSLHVSTSATPPGRNGGNMANLSGSIKDTYSYNITTAGTYYFHFSYAKDNSQSTSSDAGWVQWVTLPATQGGGSANVGGVWKGCEQWVNVSGVWKQAEPWINVGGVWKQGQ